MRLRTVNTKMLSKFSSTFCKIAGISNSMIQQRRQRSGRMDISVIINI